MNALPVCIIMLTVFLWGIMVWWPNSGGYELVLYYPLACLIAVAVLMTGMLVPLAFARCRLDRIGGICASFLPLAALLNTILLSERTPMLAAMGAGIWMIIWSIVAAIRHGSKKGLKIFLCVFSGIGLVGYLAVLLIVLYAHISLQTGDEVVRSVVSPDGALIAEEVKWGEGDGVDNIIRIRQNSERIDVLIGRLRSTPESVYNPFIGSAAIESLDWADNDTLSIRYKGHNEDVLIDIGQE